jgi:energy-coupling factor transport system permease protein
MECRCYHGGEGRTKLRLLRYRARDMLALLTVALFIAAIVAVNIFGNRFGWLYTM